MTTYWWSIFPIFLKKTAEVSPKRWQLHNTLNDVISQKTIILPLTAVSTCNPIQDFILGRNICIFLKKEEADYSENSVPTEVVSPVMNRKMSVMSLRVPNGWREHLRITERRWREGDADGTLCDEPNVIMQIFYWCYCFLFLLSVGDCANPFWDPSDVIK